MLLGVEVEDDDVAVAREALDDRTPDALTAAGDDIGQLRGALGGHEGGVRCTRGVA
jgi:hypothetical protein